MSPHPLLLVAVVGIAALGGFSSPANAQSGGYVSISIGGPVPYYYGGYGGGYGGGAIWVGGTWTHGYGGYGYHGHHHGHRHGYYNNGYYGRGYYGRGYYGRGYGYAPGYYGARGVVYPPPLPGGFYYQRGGYEYPPVYPRPYRGW
jgi:hypothetical protein